MTASAAIRSRFVRSGPVAHSNHQAGSRSAPGTVLGAGHAVGINTESLLSKNAQSREVREKKTGPYKGCEKAIMEQTHGGAPSIKGTRSQGYLKLRLHWETKISR